MKGIIVNCLTGKVRNVDTGLPFPISPPAPEPEKVDLVELRNQLARIQTNINELRIRAGLPIV